MTDEKVKPECQLTGTDGNVMALASRVSDCMRRNGMRDKVDEMLERVWNSRYPECFEIFEDYVEVL